MDHELSLSNTEHAHHPRRLGPYTWTSPDIKTRNQIDCIAIEKKWKGAIRNCKSYPGADCNTDNHLLVAKMKIKLKTGKRGKPKRLNLEALYDPKAELYSLEVNNLFKALGEEQGGRNEHQRSYGKKSKQPYWSQQEQR